LYRKAGESLRINDDVEVTVLQVRGSKVKIGVKAPERESRYIVRRYTKPSTEMATVRSNHFCITTIER
jgi:carbon storage regulator